MDMTKLEKLFGMKLPNMETMMIMLMKSLKMFLKYILVQLMEDLTQKVGIIELILLPTTCHVYFGSVIGATPDGRLAKKPVSEGISPVQGADRKGPTAVLKSAAKIDHLRTGGTLLNQKFTPQILEDEAGIESVLHLIRAYFKMDGHHIQFNVVNADTLRKAQQEPENYRDLIVRVAGYSDYFVNLGLDLQEEIIHRTEHSNF